MRVSTFFIATILFAFCITLPLITGQDASSTPEMEPVKETLTENGQPIEQTETEPHHQEDAKRQNYPCNKNTQLQQNTSELAGEISNLRFFI